MLSSLAIIDHSEVFLMDCILRHSLDYKDLCKRKDGLWRVLISMNNCFFAFIMKSTSSLLNYVSVAGSITMAKPLHHNLKLYEATPRTVRTLFWVTR